MLAAERLEAAGQWLNIGFEYRDGESFGYLELDPWLVVGASVGFGVGSETGGIRSWASGRGFR